MSATRVAAVLEEHRGGALRGQPVPALRERFDPRHAGFWQDLGALFLREVEIVFVQRVLCAGPAAHHAAAAEGAARARRPPAAEVRVRHFLVRLAEEDRHVRRVESPLDAHLSGHFEKGVVSTRHARIDRDAQHSPGLFKVGLQDGLPVVEVLPPGIGEGFVLGHHERVGVDEASTAHAGPVQNEDVSQQRQLLDPVTENPRHPEELPKVPVGPGEILRPPSLAHLDDENAVALLGEAEGGNRSAETRPHHDEIVLIRHAALPMNMVLMRGPRSPQTR